MIELALSVGLRVEDSVVHNPETLRFRVHVDAGDHPHATDHALLVATPLLAHHLDLRPEALLEHGVVEDQVRLRIDLQQRLSLLPQQTRRKLLAFEVTVYGVVSEALML